MNRLLNTAIHTWQRVQGRVQRHPRVKATLERIANREFFSDAYMHERLLADRLRNDAYARAIERYVSEKDVVLDLGTGTGLFAFLAARQHARRVYAIDHSPIVQLAERAAQENQINGIAFQQVHSSSFNPPEKLNVIIQVQAGSELFNSRMVEDLCDLRDRLLVPGGKILPNRFQLFLEPICLKDEYRIPLLWEQELYGVRFTSLEDWLRKNRRIRHTIHRRILPCEADCLLCDPEPVLSFDLLTVQPDAIPRKWSQRKTAVRAGVMDGFCLYFRSLFDDEIWVENNPCGTRTSWTCHLIRTEGLRLEPGDALHVDWEIGELADIYSWRLKYRRIPRQALSPVT